MVIAFVVAIFLLSLALGTPIAFSLAIAGAIGLAWVGGPNLVVGILSTAPGSAIGSFEFLTIPMFLLMAEFMIATGVSSTLFNAIAVWTGRLPGGLGAATAITGAAFGAISGSSTAAAATLSTTSLPAMIQQGYDRRFASGIVSISGTLAMLIPPSIAIIFYGILSGTSVAQLLVAGIIPGIFITGTIIATIWFVLWLQPGSAPAGRGYSWAEKRASLRMAGPFAGLFLFVTGLIYLGIATPVEASALGALGALLFAAFMRRLTWENFKAALAGTVMTTAMIGLVVIAAHIFSYFVAVTQITSSIVAFVGANDAHPYVILAVIIFIYLVMGCFLDLLSILILTVPIVLPVVLHLGFDPIWFGIIIILLAEIGMVTPPVGLNVFVVAKKTGQPVEEVFAGVWPHVAAHLHAILAMVIFPQIITWLPSTMTN